MTFRNPGTLYVDKSESFCGSCGKHASPYELTHESAFGWNDELEGCHVRFDTIDSNYIGLRINQWAAKMRPDLIYVGSETGPDWGEE